MASKDDKKIAADISSTKVGNTDCEQKTELKETKSITSANIVQLYQREFDVSKHKGRGQLTWSNLKQDEVKSAYQKSIRRGTYNGVSAVQLGLEMFLCGKLIRTNIITRTLIISVEDIGPAQPEAFACAADFLVPFYYRNKNDEVNNDDIMYFATICVYLARSAKTRINDWGVNLFPELKDAKNSAYSHDVEDFETPFYNSLLKKETRIAFYLATAICYHPRELKKVDVNYRSSKAHVVLWRVFDAYINQLNGDEKVKGLLYLKRLKMVAMFPNWKWKSEYSCLLHAQFITLACCRGVKMEGNKKGFNIDIPTLVTPNIIHSLVKDIVSRSMPRPEIPDYALDKHTQRGNTMGRGIQHFLTEGCKLENEDLQFSQLSEAFKNEAFPTSPSTNLLVEGDSKQ